MRAAECKERARRCTELAQKSPIARIREENLILATQWLQLAEELEELEPESRRYA